MDESQVDPNNVSVYLDFAKKVGEIPLTELAVALEQRVSITYVPNLTYYVGQVLQHGTFGRGIIIEISRDNSKTVYFPNKYQRKVLA